MQSMSDTIVEDVPVYQHTMWIMAKVRKTIRTRKSWIYRRCNKKL